MKIVFMGTPDYAATALEAILQAGYEVTGVVCQPDKPKGRSGALAACPVKECALKYNLPVFQPERIKRPEAVAELKKFPADVFVVAAFGQILSEEILTMPKYGCINIHASLLPKYRGAAPIQWCIVDGEKETGVTIMQMDAGIDTGDILFTKKVEITEEETGGSLFDKLSQAGAELIVEALPKIEAGEVNPVKQEEALSNYARMLKKEDGQINWKRPAEEIGRQVRGMDPWPSAYTYYKGKQFKIWKAQAVDGGTEGLQPGTIAQIEKQGIWIACGSGMLQVTEAQLEGKKRMSAADLMNGRSLEMNERLG
ncbi:MAG: methionyl-tRNA formyltransferase [Lachnospiraceae bacterium]|nr:methionyl-tRNA formyltransferase [Lachnospiraceae bacterium]MBR3734829.1 methionyl-tRNA formyltransferase [Lachnospiraceae bacterium]MBR6158321.1 methionyl-tRNA formyltransferase [Lachnospiraceae bacterium]